MIDSIFALTGVAGTHGWTGTGFLRMAEGDPNEARAVAQFRSYRHAEEEAMRMGALTNLHLRVVCVRLLVGEVVEEPAAKGPRRGKHPGSARIVLSRSGT